MNLENYNIFKICGQLQSQVYSHWFLFNKSQMEKLFKIIDYKKYSHWFLSNKLQMEKLFKIIDYKIRESFLYISQSVNLKQSILKFTHFSFLFYCSKIAPSNILRS